MTAGNHQRVDRVMAVIGAGLLAGVGQNVVQPPKPTEMGRDSPGYGLYLYVWPQFFQKGDGLPRRISRIDQLTAGKIIRNGLSLKPPDLSR